MCCLLTTCTALKNNRRIFIYRISYFREKKNHGQTIIAPSLNARNLKSLLYYIFFLQFVLPKKNYVFFSLYNQSHIKSLILFITNAAAYLRVI